MMLCHFQCGEKSIFHFFILPLLGDRTEMGMRKMFASGCQPPFPMFKNFAKGCQQITLLCLLYLSVDNQLVVASLLFRCSAFHWIAKQNVTERPLHSPAIHHFASMSDEDIFYISTE